MTLKEADALLDREPIWRCDVPLLATIGPFTLTEPVGKILTDRATLRQLLVMGHTGISPMRKTDRLVKCPCGCDHVFEVKNAIFGRGQEQPKAPLRVSGARVISNQR